ncbi:MAG TPA: hypothetical protein VJU60_05365 [Thermoleophilaceae bacterium]|nr:hypothetical protein [Thermoleophilaceae bacterium]
MLKRILIPAVAVAAVASAVSLASAPAAPSGSFPLLASLDRHSMVRVDARPKGTSAGDVFVFSTSLRRDGKPDGRAEFVQTVVDPRYRGVSMHADLLLADGTLELQGAGLSRRAPGGAKPSSETDMAIVGGTGAYAAANGSIKLVPVGRTTQRLEVTLSS